MGVSNFQNNMSMGVARVIDETSQLPARPARGGRRLRLWAHIYLHMQVPGFDLVPRLIGRGGCNMRRIAEETQSKIRIRGRGSGHLEVDGVREAPVPLMVAVTTDKCDEHAFRGAIAAMLRELRAMERRFHEYCAQQQLPPLEGPAFSVGNIPANAAGLVEDLLLGVPVATSTGNGR